MMTQSRLQFHGAMLLFCMAILSCGDSSTGPATEDEGGGPEPNPNGILLEGAASDNALQATRLLPPSPAEPEDILGGGLLATRVQAIVNPAATVGDVNAALTASGVRIVSMSPKNIFVTLKIPRVTSETEANALAQQLTESGAFLAASAAYQVAVPNSPTPHQLKYGVPKRVLPPSGKEGSIHHLATGIASAWNAARAATGSPKVKVLVPDKYSSTNGLPEIDALKTPVQGPLDLTDDGVMNVGNHGFHVCGIIGANFDATAPTGTNPDPANRLAIYPLSINGLTWNDMFTYIVAHFPSTGHFVMNTSLAYYNSGTLTPEHRMWLAMFAMDWRIKSAPHTSRFLHATAAGNEGAFAGDAGDARFGSPFNAARYYADLRSVVDLNLLTSADSLTVETAWSTLVSNHPAAIPAAYNILVVGSSDALGGESAFSNRNSDLRMPGEEILAPCDDQDPGFPANNTLCDGTTAKYSGTSMAAPLVAGLAAYLWSIEPSATLDDIIQAIEQSWSPANGVVDSYAATLSMDESLSEGVVRNALLDVSGSTPMSAPNGVFDEHDIEAFLAKFQEYEDQRAVYGNEVDYSRYDLSGEGYTGGTFSNRFDLDVNVPPAYSNVPQSIQGQSVFFNENGVRDLDCLCYYAYSSLYDGDTISRADLLNQKCGVVPSILYLGRTFNARASVAVSAPGDYQQEYDGLSVDDKETAPLSFSFDEELSVSSEGHTSYAKAQSSAGQSIGLVDDQLSSFSIDYDYIGEVNATFPPNALAAAASGRSTFGRKSDNARLGGVNASDGFFSSEVHFQANEPIDIVLEYQVSGDCQSCEVVVWANGEGIAYSASTTDVISGVTGAVRITFAASNFLAIFTSNDPSPQSLAVQATLNVGLIGN